LSVTRLEGTYLVWVDCRSLGESSVVLAQRLRKEHKVWLNAGSLYGSAGEGFLRINIACPRSLLKTGLERIAEGLK
jgi:cystathionine beta-lyase